MSKHQLAVRKLIATSAVLAAFLPCLSHALPAILIH